MAGYSSLSAIQNEWFDRTVPYPDPDPNGFQGQCVQFIRYCLANYYGTPQWGTNIGAADFWINFDITKNMGEYWERITNTPDFIPDEGDICIWNKNKGGGYGHIAIVFGPNQSLRWLTCIEQNWKPLKVTVVQHSYNDVLGFLRKKEL